MKLDYIDPEYPSGLNELYFSKEDEKRHQMNAEINRDVDDSVKLRLKHEFIKYSNRIDILEKRIDLLEKQIKIIGSK